ncbi:MAG: tetratricopeptide repeat protein [Sedimentisphaerales bacterium]|nr:tetratricopeptide repeat protein [Sedimentisphaerales bacterium]
MPRRYFNWKLAIVLIIGICVLGVTAIALRQWQRTHRAEQGLILGNKAYDKEKWDEAAKYFGRYLTIEQVDVPILMKYADAQLKIRPSKRGNIAQALNAYRTVLRADKSNSEAVMLLTELYLMMGDPGEAELIVSKYFDNNDDTDPELREMLARVLEKQRKFNEAEAELKAIIQEHPDQISAYEMLGKLAEENPDDITDSNEPVHWFNEAVDKNLDSALAYIARAGFYQSKDPNEALTNLDVAEKKDLSDPNVELRLASEFIKANNLDKAEKHLKAVQLAKPKDLGLWVVWAELAMKSQSQEKMLKIAESGLKELSSQPWDFMPTATELFIRSGQLDRAEQCISEMNQKDIAPMAVTFLEGFLAFNRGNLVDACDYWQESIGLGNKSPIVRLMLSSAFSRVGDKESAIRQLRTLVSENSDFVAGHLALAKLYADTQNWTESARSAATAKQISPENPEASLLYLQAQMQLRTVDPVDENVLTFQEIEKQLSEMEKTANHLPEFILLKFQLALKQSNFTYAQALVAQLKKLVTELKKDDPLQIKITWAEVELLVAQGKTDEAISTLSEALVKSPQTIELIGYLANLYDRQGDYEKCEETINEAIKRIDQPDIQCELGLLLARYYVQWNQKDKFYSHLNTLVQQLPEDILLKRWLLCCEQIANDSAKAQQIVDEIKELEGAEGWQWRYEQARIWFLPKDFEARYAEILSLLQYNIKANPNNQESRVLLASAYSQADELQLAISTYREALDRSPDDLRIIVPLIDILSKSMKFDEVDELLKRIGDSEQDLYKTQLQEFQLQSHLRHGQLSSASNILQDFISSDPNDQANRFFLALLKTEQGKYDQAKELLDELKIQYPNSMKIAVAQIRLNILQNKNEEALRLCDEMVNNLNDASAYILRARTNATLKQIDKAIEDYEYAAAIGPNNVDVWRIKSNFYRFIGRPDKAIADINEALSLAPDDIRIRKQAIALLLESGDMEKVLQGKADLAKALKSDPNDIELRLLKANSLLMENTAPAIEKATEILQKITEDQPEISMAWVLLGNLSVKEQPEKAMEIAFRGLSHSPNNMSLLLLKVRAEKNRAPALAIPTLKALLEADPNNTEVVLLLAETYCEAGEPEKAVNFLKSLLASRVGTPDERIIKIGLAVALYKNGSSANAKEEFDSLIQSEKDSFVLINIANKLFFINDSQARKTSENILREKVLNEDPNSVGAMTVLCNILQISGRSDESIRFYQRVLELQPDNIEVINNLAWMWSENKDRLQEALELAEKGLNIDPNYVDLIDTRGVIYYKLGEFDKAVEDFVKCIKLYKRGAPAAIGSHIYLAKSFKELGQRNQAVEHLNQALDLNRALEPEKRIGILTTSDIAEAQQLLEQLQEGN